MALAQVLPEQDGSHLRRSILNTVKIKIWVERGQDCHITVAIIDGIIGYDSLNLSVVGNNNF